MILFNCRQCLDTYANFIPQKIKVQLIIFSNRRRMKIGSTGKFFMTASWKVKWNLFVYTIHVCNILPLSSSFVYVSVTKRLYISFSQKGASLVFWQDFEAMWIIFIYIMCVFILSFRNTRNERAPCYDLLLKIDLQRERKKKRANS